jgi:hypothetical protein
MRLPLRLIGEFAKQSAFAVLIASCGVPDAAAPVTPASPPPLRHATEAMQKLTLLVTTGDNIKRCELHHFGEDADSVCVAATANANFGDWLANSLGRAGFNVVRDRMLRYDLELVAAAGIVNPGGGGGGWVSISGVSDWPLCDDDYCRRTNRTISIYTYSISKGEPQITSGLRKNDSGGWRARMAPDDIRLRSNDSSCGCNCVSSDAGPFESSATLSSCFPQDGDAFRVGRTLQEGEDPQGVAAYVTNQLVTCDQLESFAVVLNGGAYAAPASYVPGACAPPPPPPTQAQLDTMASRNNCVGGCNAQYQACGTRSVGARDACDTRCSTQGAARDDCELGCSATQLQETQNCNADLTVCQSGCH